MAPPGDLWGVVYLDVMPAIDDLSQLRSLLRLLASHTSQQLLLANVQHGLTSLMALPVHVLTPRYPGQGTLSAWLSLWEDTPAGGALMLSATYSSQPKQDVLAQLAAAHGQTRLLAANPRHPFPAYYSRACLGTGLRMWRQEVRDLQPLLKALKAPMLE